VDLACLAGFTFTPEPGEWLAPQLKRLLASTSWIDELPLAGERFSPG